MPTFQINLFADSTWLSFWDAYNEGHFTSASDSHYILNEFTYQNWDLGEPNGDVIENCAVTRRTFTYWGRWSGWNDKRCIDRECSVCQIFDTPRFELRGMLIPIQGVPYVLGPTILPVIQR